MQNTIYLKYYDEVLFDGWLIEKVPKKFRDAEMWMAAVSAGYPYCLVPHEVLGSEVCKEMRRYIRKNGGNFGLNELCSSEARGF